MHITKYKKIITTKFLIKKLLESIKSFRLDSKNIDIKIIKIEIIKKYILFLFKSFEKLNFISFTHFLPKINLKQNSRTIFYNNTTTKSRFFVFQFFYIRYNNFKNFFLRFFYNLTILVHIISTCSTGSITIHTYFIDL